MTTDVDRLYDLVPAVYRMRDADQGYPLRALLRTIGEQLNVVQNDVAGLYENWFIETCADWAVPYIGALIGYSPVAGIADSRRDVANTIRSRRRKGTLSLLQDLAEAAAGWPSRAVEFYRLLSVTQNVDFLRMDRGRTAELRDGGALEAIGTAFDVMARNVDVRRVDSTHTIGAANIPEVGVFLWRLRPYTVTMGRAYPHSEASSSSYLFNALGHDVALYANPSAAGADPALPVPITRRGFDARDNSQTSTTPSSGVPYYYGPGRSLQIWTGTTPVPVPPDAIVPADLRDWSYRPGPNQVAVDPVLGRIVFPPMQGRPPIVRVSYVYAFSTDLGGGEYPRTLDVVPNVYRVGGGMPYARISAALAAWQSDAPADAAIEIADSDTYSEPVAIDLAENQTLRLRAVDGTRPVISVHEPDNVSVVGATGSRFVLDGITISGCSLLLAGDMTSATIRHSTLVPGWALSCNCEPKHPTEPSIEIDGPLRCVTIDHSIVGAIRVNRDETLHDPMQLHVCDSVVDATGKDEIALGAAQGLCADTVLTLRRSTVIGQVQSHTIALAENSILDGVVHACRRQRGCIRFCYVAPGSDTPRRYECQPDLVEAAVEARYAAGDLDAVQRDALLEAEALRVEPDFDGTRYGTPAYCRLATTCAIEISSGAEDGSEMGVFHDLYASQRVAALAQRLDEYTPAGTDTGIIFAS